MKVRVSLQALMFATLLLPATLISQVSRLTLDLSNAFSRFSRGRATVDVREQQYDQLYTLEVAGYAINPNLVSFSLRSGFRDRSLKTYGSYHSKSNARSFDLFNIHVDLFRRSPIPITLYGSRNTQANSYVYPTTQKTTSYEALSSVLGFTASVEGNTYWPNFRVGWNRSTTEGTSPLNPFDRTSNNLRVSMSNSDDDKISSYSLQYESTNSSYELNRLARLTENQNIYLRQPQNQNSLSAAVRTTLWDDVRVAMDFDQQNQDQLANRGIGLNLMFPTGARFAHTTNVRQHRNSGYGLSTDSYTVGHSMSINAGARHSASVRGEFTNTETRFAQTRRSYRRLSGGGSWTGSFELSEANALTTSATGSLGSEGYGGSRPITTYGLSGNAVLRSQLTDWLRSTLSDDVSISRYLVQGRTFTNRTQLSFYADPGIATTFQSDLSYSDSHFLDQIYLPRLAVTEGSLGATTSLIPTLSVNITVKRALYRSIYRNLLSAVSGSVIHRGLVRDLTSTVSVEFTRSTFPRVETVRLQASAAYQFYAYSLTGRYFFDKFAGYMFHGFSLDIKRQISFDFQ